MIGTRRQGQIFGFLTVFAIQSAVRRVSLSELAKGTPKTGSTRVQFKYAESQELNERKAEKISQTDWIEKRLDDSSFAYAQKFASWSSFFACVCLSSQLSLKSRVFSSLYTAIRDALGATITFFQQCCHPTYHYAESVTIENQVTVSPLGFLRYQSVSFPACFLKPLLYHAHVAHAREEK